MDIKETKEGLIALGAAVKAIKEVTADGVQPKDGLALLQKYNDDEAFRAKIDAGVQGANKIPAELADLGLVEGIDLLRMLPGLFQ